MIDDHFSVSREGENFYESCVSNAQMQHFSISEKFVEQRLKRRYGTIYT